MAGGRVKGATLKVLALADKATWPLDAKVWVPGGHAGWLQGVVIGYTPRFIKCKTSHWFCTRNVQPHRLRLRTNDTPPKDPAY